MKKKIIALAAAFAIAFGISGCNDINSSSGNSGSTSSNNSSNKTDSSDNTSPESPDNSSSNSNEITTNPLKVKCGDIIEIDGIKTFDVETTCGNAFVVGYHYIRGTNGRIENAIASFKPLGVTDLRSILNDPVVGGSELSESDFTYSNGVYRMNEEKAKTLLGSLASTYNFDEYWKNQKMAELVSTEGISAEEARPKVDEMFENMGKNPA